MSALPRFGQALRPMTQHDVDSVLEIERAAYEFPWSHGNFIDSLHAGHPAAWLQGDAGQMRGYFVAMHGVEEIHLLNLTVAPKAQGLGHGRQLLQTVVDIGRQHGAHQVWLEVRRHNERAQRFYARFGFAGSGVRKAYYPAARGQREDAIVMRLGIDSTPGRRADALD